MLKALVNPDRFMVFSRWAAPMFGAIAAVALAAGLWFALRAPEAEGHYDTVRIMFIHVPAAILSMFIYVCLGVASFLALVFRHTLADMAARAAAPVGAAYTALALITGSIWGRPTWGAWWAWDGRMTSVLVLFLLYLGYMALRAAIDDEAKAGRAAAILALVGVVNIPVIHFSVYWWNSLHQGTTIGRGDLNPAYALPLALMGVGYLSLFGSLWLVRIRTEIWRRRAVLLSLRAAEAQTFA